MSQPLSGILTISVENYCTSFCTILMCAITNIIFFFLLSGLKMEELKAQMSLMEELAKEWQGAVLLHM